MKKYITLFMIVAMAFLFVGQRDSFAKTARAASEELSKERDGDTYYQLKAPKTYRVELEMEEVKTDIPRLGRLFTVDIESLQSKVSKFWDQMLPVISKKLYKFVAVVD